MSHTFHQLTVSVPTKVVVETDGSAGTTELWLFGPGNWTSQLAHDASSGKNYSFSRIVTTLQPGTYYVKVGEYGQNAVIDNYTLSVFSVPVSDPRDPQEPDASSAQAVLVPADGSRRLHNFHQATDVDWVKFDVAERSQVVVQTDGSAGDTRLWLFAEGSNYAWSNSLKSDDDNGYGNFSRIATYLEPGRYYAATAEYGQDATIEAFTLSVTATPLRLLADAFEAAGDNTAGGATPVTLGTTTSAHSLHDVTDVDWFRFQVAIPSLVTLATSGPPVQDYESLRLQLFGPNSSTPSIYYSSGSGANCQIQWVLQPGTYFVSAQESSNDQILRQYFLNVSAAPLSDLQVLSGSLSTAGPVGLGETVGVQWSVQNLGPGDTDPARTGYAYWYDYVYLSLDNTYDSSDYYLGSWSHGSDRLDPGKQYVAYRSVTLPSDTKWAGRSAYLLVLADGDHDLEEARETNNGLAIPIQTNRSVTLQAPYDGRYVDAYQPVEFRWLALDAQPGAVVNLALDTDADPQNGVYRWLLQDQPVSGQRTVESAMLSLSPLAPRSEPYYVWVQVSDALGSQNSAPMAIFVADRAYVSERLTISPVGGSSYAVLGIEAADLGTTYHVRVRTNFRPDGGSGGDLHLVAGGTTYGLCVKTHTIADGSQVSAGELYAGAEFLRGTVVKSVPTFINRYTARITGKSTVQVLATSDEDWDYEILATFQADAFPLGPEGFSVGWAMYCGNDTDEVEVPEEKPDLMLSDLAFQNADGSAQFRYAIANKALTSPSTVAVYWAVGPTAADIRGGPISSTATALAIGSYGPLPVPAALLRNRPSGCTHLIAMINPEGSVDETDSDNDTNNLRAVAVSLEARLLRLEATDDIPILDETSGRAFSDVVWQEGAAGSTLPLADGISGPGLPGVTITATFDCNLDPRTDPLEELWVRWSVFDSHSRPLAGNTERIVLTPVAGSSRLWKGSFSIVPPAVVGQYLVTQNFHYRSPSSLQQGASINVLQSNLYRTFNVPQDRWPGGTAFPEKAFWLATSFTDGETDKVAALESLTQHIHALGWTYTTDYTHHSELETEDFTQYALKLLYGGKKLASCQHYAAAWAHLAKVLGIEHIKGNELLTARTVGASAFITKQGLVSSNKQKGNTAPGTIPLTQPDPVRCDRWTWGKHVLGTYYASGWFGLWGTTHYFDPTYGTSSTDKYANVETDIMSVGLAGNHYLSVDGTFELWTSPSWAAGGPNAYPHKHYIYEQTVRSPSVSESSAAGPAGVFGRYYSAYGVDADGDGQFDALAVDVDVQDGVGDFEVLGTVAQGEAIVASTSRRWDPQLVAYPVTLTQNAVTVAHLLFSGEQILSSGRDGVYRVDLQLVNENGLVDALQFETPAMNHADFGEIDARVTSFSDRGADSDHDGVFDQLVADIGVTLTGYERYRVEATLADAYGTVLDTASADVSGAGRHDLQLAFDGRRISAAGGNGPYAVRIEVYDDSGSALAVEDFNTQSYTTNQFESPPAHVQYLSGERAQDTNGNGLLDVLTIDAHVVVAETGSYVVQAQLCDSQGQVANTIVTSVSLAGGSQTIPLQFDGRTIGVNDYRGPFRVSYFGLQQQLAGGAGAGLLSGTHNVYTTAAYRSSQFEGSTPRPWQNEMLLCDVTGGGRVTPLDVLALINYLNTHGTGALPSAPIAPNAPPPYVDVDGDGNGSPADVLLVINYLDSQITAAAEGEATTGVPPSPELGGLSPGDNARWWVSPVPLSNSWDASQPGTAGSQPATPLVLAGRDPEVTSRDQADWLSAPPAQRPAFCPIWEEFDSGQVIWDILPQDVLEGLAGG